MRTLLCLIFLCTGIVVLPTHGQSTTDIYSAAYVHDECKVAFATPGDAKMASKMTCINRVVGWREVIDAYAVLIAKGDARVQTRIDSTATNGQLARVLILYVEKHPELENKAALIVFILALREAGLLTEQRVTCQNQ